VTFIVFSMAVIAWSLSVLRWSISIRRGRGRKMMRLLSCAVIVAGAFSIASDVRFIAMARSAAPSDLDVKIIRRGSWWQLDYAQRGVALRTANELHVPAGVRLTLEWSGDPPPIVENALCLSQTETACIFVAGSPSVRDARFVSAWPPAWRRLRMVVQSRDQFDRWFSDQAQPARTPLSSQASLFGNAGCAYCHVIRGIVNEPWRAGPDLTHFASRATIAATDLPNRRGQLSGWIVHSRALKTESEMPDNALAPDDLRAVVAFLESLR
jgi:cytochrome c oxidase subunit 2